MWNKIQKHKKVCSEKFPSSHPVPWKESEVRSVVSDFLQPIDYTIHEILQAKILEWVAFPFFRWIFPTQGLNPGLLHCRQILYQLSHKGSSAILEWVAYPFSSRSSRPRNLTGSPELQADSLPTELSGKPQIPGGD